MLFNRPGTHSAGATDDISPSVSLGRPSHGCLYNTLTGSSSHGPSGTKWAPGSFATVGAENLNNPANPYGYFCQQTDRSRSRIGTVEQLSNWVMHVEAEDLYFDITFHSCACLGPGWCTRRSSPF